MKITLHSDVNRTISVNELEDGQVGVIQSWPAYSHYVGKMVQRYRNEPYGGKDTLIIIGEPAGRAFTNSEGFKNWEDCRVKLVYELRYVI